MAGSILPTFRISNRGFTFTQILYMAAINTMADDTAYFHQAFREYREETGDATDYAELPVSTQRDILRRAQQLKAGAHDIQR